jgi:CheY-like chemotaxis protein
VLVCPAPSFEKSQPGGKPAAVVFSQNHREKVAEASVVLVVEDDWLLRQALQTELELAGWIVREAESGETALTILQGGGVALLITDIRLGGTITGWDLAETAREENADLPVVYVSGNPLLEARRVLGSIFLAKPCDTAKLVRVCKALMDEDTRSAD